MRGIRMRSPYAKLLATQCVDSTDHLSQFSSIINQNGLNDLTLWSNTHNVNKFFALFNSIRGDRHTHTLILLLLNNTSINFSQVIIKHRICDLHVYSIVPRQTDSSNQISDIQLIVYFDCEAWKSIQDICNHCRLENTHPMSISINKHNRSDICVVDILLLLTWGPN